MKKSLAMPNETLKQAIAREKAPSVEVEPEVPKKSESLLISTPSFFREAYYKRCK